MGGGGFENHCAKASETRLALRDLPKLIDGDDVRKEIMGNDSPETERKRRARMVEIIVFQHYCVLGFPKSN